MKKGGWNRFLLALALPLATGAQTGIYSGGSAAAGKRELTMVVHGGTSSATTTRLTKGQEARYRDGLARALGAGMAQLEHGGSSLDAVTAAIVVLEDDPMFNAGKGAVLSSEGRAELDAAVMDGRTGKAGAVASVTVIKNPILAARAVMERTPYVLLVGLGADKFGASIQLEIVDPSYFITEPRLNQLKNLQEQERKRESDLPHGTVGALAIDKDGNLAAATSTGGLANKRHGRVGDSPIIGAGTYADNTTVAVSATGTGEFFMRGAVAYDISARMKYLKLGVADAAEATLREAVDEKKGDGGVIALDRDGNVRWVFNTPAMSRGYLRAGGKPEIEIFR